MGLELVELAMEQWLVAQLEFIGQLVRLQGECCYGDSHHTAGRRVVTLPAVEELLCDGV